jgi:drug/metabolite transporter (DMT)-like permease
MQRQRRFPAALVRSHPSARRSGASFPRPELIGTPIAGAVNSMKQIIGIAFLVAGVVLLCLAYDSYHSAASNVSRAVTGTSTDKTLWLAVGGILGSLIGLGGLITGRKT